jgi:aminoglycoside phosphotransferase (APT) family kinase protein
VSETRRAVAGSDAPGLVVTEFLPGVRGDLLLPTLDDGGLGKAGAAVGRVAATLAGMPTLRPGTWVDGDLRIAPFEEPELRGWVRRYADQLVDWSPAELDGLAAVAADAEALLETVPRTCVAHGDLNPKNLLFDADSLEITGVLDWEYCHSGHPFTDLGNALRFDRAPAYVDGILDAWADRHGTPAADALALARSADLVSLVDLAARAGENPVADAAHERLRAIARSGDVHAVD